MAIPKIRDRDQILRMLNTLHKDIDQLQSLLHKNEIRLLEKAVSAIDSDFVALGCLIDNILSDFANFERLCRAAGESVTCGSLVGDIYAAFLQHLQRVRVCVQLAKEYEINRSKRYIQIDTDIRAADAGLKLEAAKKLEAEKRGFSR